MKKISLNVKPFQETLHADMCRPASLKIVLNYYKINKTEKELAELTKVTQGLGVDDKKIAAIARSLHFKVTIKNKSTFADIEKWLSKGVPVIVDWFTRGRQDYSDSEVPDGHYSVVMGLNNKYIYLQDPEIGKQRKMTREDFMKVWFDFTGRSIKPDELIIRQVIAIHPKIK
jgi:ABC-type bacteriocin/lantibiotic exporter with double-glycine peptidase domain